MAERSSGKPLAGNQTLSANEVDWCVNALFSAIRYDIGRPFNTGRRNVRSIVRGWCPLSHNTNHYDPMAFAHEYQSAHFFDRFFYTEEVGRTDLREQAFTKFKTNVELGFACEESYKGFKPGCIEYTVLSGMAARIRHVLGLFDESAWFSFCKHGPNSTLGVRLDEAYPPAKLSTIEGTVTALAHFARFVDSTPTLARELREQGLLPSSSWKLVSGSRLSFVPKKFDSLRTMMIEPTTNQFLQQGLGGYIAARLKKRANIDLETQPGVHRQLVKLITSHNLHLATIDWSSASDRLFLCLAEHILPWDWLAVVKDIRSPSCTFKVDKDREVLIELPIIGSMGNGFTFPLQTLIFEAFLYVCSYIMVGTPLGVSVFGDDCIVDSHAMPLVKKLAKSFGWSLNVDKTFEQGRFRESCGMDCFAGLAVRPFYVTRPKTLTSKLALVAWLYTTYNLTREKIHGAGRQVDAWFLAWLKRLGEDIVYVVPRRFPEYSGIRLDALSDIHLIQDEHLRSQVASAVARLKRDIHGGFVLRCVLTKAGRAGPFKHNAYYLLALEGRGVPRFADVWKTDSATEDHVTEPPSFVLDEDSKVPSRNFVYKRTKVHCFQWLYPFS